MNMSGVIKGGLLAGLVLNIGEVILNGLFPSGLMIVALAWAIVEVPLAVTAGAWLYKENGGDAAAA